MTTMELNLRKEYLYDLIKGMDEERLSKVETYIKRLCLAKQKESLYPWAPDEAELTCKIAESEVDFNNGDYCTQKALKKKLQKKKTPTGDFALCGARPSPPTARAAF